MSTYKSKQLGRIIEEVLIFHVSLCEFSLSTPRRKIQVFFVFVFVFFLSLDYSYPNLLYQRVIGEVGRSNWVLTHESDMRSLLQQLTPVKLGFSAYVCTFIKVLLEACYLGNWRIMKASFGCGSELYFPIQVYQ